MSINRWTDLVAMLPRPDTPKQSKQSQTLPDNPKQSQTIPDSPKQSQNSRQPPQKGERDEKQESHYYKQGYDFGIVLYNKNIDKLVRMDVDEKE